MKNWQPYGGNSGIAVYISGIESVEVIDPLTVQINTYGLYGPLLRNLRAAYIMNKAYTEKMTAEQGIEEVGRSPMGTGPFQFVEWVPGDHMTMERFDDYWGEKAGVETVVFRQISNNATRTAALLSGEIQIATELPPRDVPRVENSPTTKVEILDGMRTVNFRFDTIREETPGIPGIPNPLRDVRVREAINYAINADAITKIVMNGFATPSTQLAGRQHFGWSPAIERSSYDPEKAKALLAEAGYEDGFPIRVDSPNNRYVNDEQICLAVAQMLTQVGLQATCRARPKQIFFREVQDDTIQCCSMFMFSFVTPTADIAGNLEANFHTPTADGLFGFFIVYFSGPGILNVIIAMTAAEWVLYACTARANTIVEREKTYIDAARVMGASNLRILGKYVLPNIAHADAGHRQRALCLGDHPGGEPLLPRRRCSARAALPRPADPQRLSAALFGKLVDLRPAGCRARRPHPRHQSARRLAAGCIEPEAGPLTCRRPPRRGRPLPKTGCERPGVRHFQG